MKSAIAFAFVVIASVSSFGQSSLATAADPKSVVCWGTDNDGVKVTFNFDMAQETIVQSVEVVTPGDMPPYPQIEQARWKLESMTVDRQKVSIAGRTTGVTTGMSGRVTITGAVTGASTDHGLDRVFYGSEVSILPATRRVLPRAATVYGLNCEARW